MAVVAAAVPRAVPTAADFFLYCTTHTPAQSSAGGIFLPYIQTGEMGPRNFKIEDLRN